jgi:Derlin-2/3
MDMDQMGAMGAQAGFPLETWFWEMPLCTRWWTTATVLTSALVQCQIVTPFQLFYSFRAVFYKNQVCSPTLSPSHFPLCPTSPLPKTKTDE